MSNTENSKRAKSSCQTVSEIMRPATTVKSFDKMDDVLEHLTIDHSLAAPVVDEMGHCTGVLTMTDINRYRETKRKYENGDLSSLDAVFEVDPYGLRRINIEAFDQVNRHMTKPAVTIRADKTRCNARKLFEYHDEIHHLIVVDEYNRPVGVLEISDLECASVDATNGE